MVELEGLLCSAHQVQASDIHLAPNELPAFRINGEIVRWGKSLLSVKELDKWAAALVPEDRKERLKLQGDVDVAHTFAQAGRYRINLFCRCGLTGMVLRPVSERIPAPEELAVPEICLHMAEQKQGLILATGPAGSGKSTTLAALVGYIGRRYGYHIVTLEDPVEYIYPPSKSLISQREIGTDCPSFATGLRAALRQDPDVILVGELRDLETVKTAMTAAETGHLILGTLHTNDTVQAIDRIIDVFDGEQQKQIRIQLASVLVGVVAQRLIPRADGCGRVAAFEVLLGQPAVQNLIREGKTHQIPTLLQTGGKQGMRSMEQSVQILTEAGLIRRDKDSGLATLAAQKERWRNGPLF